MPKSSPFQREEASAGDVKTLMEYIEDKLTVAGFEFIEDNNDIIAWPEGTEGDAIKLEFHAPGAYAVVNGKGFFESPGRQKAFQNQIVNWVYEYYSGGAYRFL